MDSIQTLDNNMISYSVDNAMRILFDKLDEALADYENGRVISEEQMMEELQSV